MVVVINDHFGDSFLVIGFIHEVGKGLTDKFSYLGDGEFVKVMVRFFVGSMLRGLCLVLVAVVIILLVSFSIFIQLYSEFVNLSLLVEQHKGKSLHFVTICYQYPPLY